MAKKSTPSDNTKNKMHPWRHCPVGKHYVREHSMHIPPSKEHPKGQVVIRHAHCRTITNSSKLIDSLSFDEIMYISNSYFSDLSGPPTANSLKDFKKLGDKYDILIRGWVRYWNDVLKYKEPLDPNLIKALIASESSFDANSIHQNGAHGLMQLMPETFSYIKHDSEKTDLKDHFVNLTKKSYLDPSANICAGVRWLFRKKSTASGLLGRDATWIEAVADYKGYLKNIVNGKDPNPGGMKRFNELYAEINKKQS